MYAGMSALLSAARADFNWSLGPITLGDEDEKSVTRAVGLLLRRLQDRYEMID
jgi:hypothetical protein